MRTLTTLSIVLLTIFCAVPASAAPVAHATDLLSLDCAAATSYCWVPCRPGPVGIMCGHDTPDHGYAGCIVFITYTSTCINPTPL